MSEENGWLGVDLDGTLAHYDKWRGIDHIGNPVPRMVNRVKQWRKAGVDVRIFTARIHPSNNLHEKAKFFIRNWCLKHIGELLPIVYEKDLMMNELWDDRAVQVIPNTGKRADGRE